MQNIRQIYQTIEEDQSLKLVAQTYTEIAAIKLQKIRSGIERNRNFSSEIAQIYHNIRLVAQQRKIPPRHQKKGTVSLILTSNHRFYGSLEARLIRFFMVQSSKYRTDRIVIGRAALDYFHSIHYFPPFKSFILKEDLPKTEEIAPLSSIINQYEKVIVYYSSFKSVMSQNPRIIDITQSSTPSFPKIDFDYIFEPELADMLDFFETQINILLLEQSFLESELARTAARLISMDQAEGSADKLIVEQKKLLASAKRSIDNNRLLDTIATLVAIKQISHA